MQRLLTDGLLLAPARSINNDCRCPCSVVERYHLQARKVRRVDRRFGRVAGQCLAEIINHCLEVAHDVQVGELQDKNPPRFETVALLQVVPEEGQDVHPEDIHHYDDPPFDDGNHLAHGVDLAISTKESAG